MSYRRSNWFAVWLLLAASVPGFAITGVDLLPTDAIEDGRPASTMFTFLTDGSDDLAISARSTAGDFRFLSATATVTFDEPPPPPDGDVPEPATALLLGAGLAGFGSMQRKRVRLQ